MLDILANNLRNAGLLHPQSPTRLVVAYSGGCDSTALLHLLAELRDTQGYPLEFVAAYHHHFWRALPPRELPVLHKNTQRLNVPLMVIAADRALPKTETAARDQRYAQLTRLAADIGADAVITAHHADDQVETVLFRIFRGTGLDGLGGIHRRLVPDSIPGARPVPIIRPLLDISRQALASYVAERELPAFQDPGNKDTRHHRNLIRHEILPALEREFPNVKNALFKLALVAEGDARVLCEGLEPIWAEISGHDKLGLYVDVSALSLLDEGRQRRLLRRLLRETPQTGQLRPDFQAVEEMLAFVRGDGRRRQASALKSLPGNTGDGHLFLSLYRNRLRVVSRPAGVEAIAPIALGADELAQPQIYRLAEQDIRIEIRPIAPDDNRRGRKRPDQNNRAEREFLEYADEITLGRFGRKPLAIRARQPGDRFHAPGMGARMRLKKYFINRGVPRFERDTIPVLAVDDVILAVPGFALSDELRPDADFEPTHRLRIDPLASYEAWEAARKADEKIAAEAAAAEEAARNALKSVLEESEGDMIGEPAAAGNLAGDSVGESIGIGDLTGQSVAVGDLMGEPVDPGDLTGESVAIRDLAGENDDLDDDEDGNTHEHASIHG